MHIGRLFLKVICKTMQLKGSVPNIRQHDFLGSFDN